MPIASFKAVRGVSSEDAIHLAENLMKDKKWRTKACGEKSAYVIFELKESYQITGIDIGNEHSAFVEVFAGKLGCAQDEYEEILIMHSFMTPIESKNSTNPNRVRCFGKDALVAAAASEKWQMIKIICTQPFNKHVQYGLSFIKIHVAENLRVPAVTNGLAPEKCLQSEAELLGDSKKKDTGQSASQKPKAFGFGKFVLREESPDSESESTAAHFNLWKTTRSTVECQTAKPLTAAAAIREASSPASLSRRLSGDYEKKRKQLPSSWSKIESPQAQDKTEQKIIDRNREQLLFGDETKYENLYDTDVRKQRLAKEIEADRGRMQQKSELLKELKEKKKLSDIHKANHQSLKSKDAMPTVSPSHNVVKKHNSSSSEAAASSRKRPSSPSAGLAKKTRADPAANYRPFNQLLRGVVLVISGIQNPDRADLRTKALALGAKYKGDWEQSCTHLICAFKNTPKYNQVKGKGKIVKRNWIEDCYQLRKRLPWRRYALDSAEKAKPESDEELLDESLKSIDVKDDGGGDASLCNINLESGSDTDDEIQRVIENNASVGNVKENANKNKSKKRDIYDATTEEEDFLKELH